MQIGFDILVTQALDVQDDVYFDTIFPRADRLLGNIGLDDGMWFGWEEISAARDSGEAVPQGVDHPFVASFRRAWYFPLAFNTRVTHRQRAADVGLDSFWEKDGFRLVERGHVLLVNDHAQFLVVFHYSLRKDVPEQECCADASEKDISAILIDICHQRSVSANLGQQRYATKVLHDAVCEVDRLCTSMVDGVIRPTGVAGRYATSVQHTAFPWIFSGYVDPGITEIFGSQEDEEIRNFSVSAESSTRKVRYIGWNYAVFRDGTPLPGSTWQLAPLCAYMQYSYIQMRKVQSYALATMGRLFQPDRHVDLEDEHLRFEKISLGYERYVLDYNRFMGSRIPSHGAIAEDVERRWELKESILQLKQSVSFDRDFLASRFQHNLHRDSRSQNKILAAIAIVQLLTLVGVVADYSSLKPSVQSYLLGHARTSSDLNGFERLFFSHVTELLVVLVALSFTLVLLVYTKSFLASVRSASRRLRRLFGRAVAKLSSRGVRTRQARGCRIARSPIHGLGLFVRRRTRKDDLILEIGAGRRMSEDDYLRSDIFPCEWNAVGDGDLFVRPERTDYWFINHSREPNAKVSVDASRRRVRVRAIRDLEKGEEICIDYREEPLSRQYIVEDGGYL